MKNTENNKYIELFNNMRKTPRGRAILFFAFYILFFAFIYILLAFNSSTSKIKSESVEKNTSAYSFKELEKENYHFNYEIILNNNYKYIGDKNKDSEVFTFNNNNEEINYKLKDNKYLANINNNWEEKENPYILQEFMELDNLKNIIDSSKYMSKTIYESSKETYHYQVSTTSVEEIVNKNKIDIDDIPNEIDVTVENGEVDGIYLKLNSYIHYKNNNLNDCSIKLEYSKFGKIKEL